MERRRALFLIFIFVFNLLLRLPSLFEPYSYADEGIYLVLGQALRKGLVWYREIHDNKPPMLYLLAAIAGSVFWLRMVLLISNFLNICLIYRLAKKFFEERISLLVMLIFAIFSTIRLFEGQMANAEIFMILPTSAAVLLMARYAIRDTRYGKERKVSTVSLLAGGLFSMATLFKVPAAFDLAGICFFLIFLSGKEILQSIKQVVLIGLGFVIPILATVVYYWSKGALLQYLRAAFLQNIGYLSSWGTGSHQANITQSGLLQRGIILLAILLCLFLLRKRAGKEFLLVMTWFFFSLFGALLSERPYPHYLMQVVPAVSLIIGFLFSKSNLQKLGALGGVGILIFSFVHFRFWHYETIPYCQTFYQYLLGRKTKQEWWGYFGDQIERVYQTGEVVKKETDPEERIFVWGTEPGIYYLSERLPVGRYTVSYHIKDFKAYEETREALEIYQPRLIVKLANEQDFPELNTLLEKEYTLQKTLQNIEIYKKSL